MDSWGLIAFILCCGLFADTMVIKARLKKLRERVDTLEKSLDKHF